jgi:hypothetical protein
MRDVLDAVQADMKGVEARKEATRAAFPDLMPLLDSLRVPGAEVRLRHAVNALGFEMGKKPEPDACVVSGDFIHAMCSYGAKK